MKRLTNPAFFTLCTASVGMDGEPFVCLRIVTQQPTKRHMLLHVDYVALIISHRQ
jgi:hypothetical protein